MIVGMNKVSLFIIEKYKEQALIELSRLGSIHINYNDSNSEEANKLKSRITKINKIKSFLSSAKQKVATSYTSDIEHVVNRLIDNIELYEQNKSTLISLKNQVDSLVRWGNFKVEDLQYLTNNKIHLKLFLINNEKLAVIDDLDGITFINLGFSKESKDNAIVAISHNIELFNNIPIEPIKFQSTKSLNDLNNEITELTKENERIYQKIVAEKAYAQSINSYEKELLTKQEFINTKDSLESDDICTITGYIPTDKLAELNLAIKKFNWGLAVSAPNKKDTDIPVKLKYNFISRLIKPVTDFLEINPNYWEPDISLSFFMFFAIFFAMIVGDAAYGLFFIAIGLYNHIVSKKLNTLAIMFYILGSITVVWGGLTGSWFGSKILAEIPFLKSLIYWKLSSFSADLFANELDLTKQEIAKIQQNAIMTVCFVLAVIHLSIARLWSFIRKLPSLNAISELAVFSLLLGLFNVVMFMIGITDLYPISKYLIVVGIIGMIVFREQENGKSFIKGLLEGVGGVKLLNIFLDSVGVFADIMSYIRLFAVGMASFSIASSFNGMASDLNSLGGVFYIFGTLIFIIGHMINFTLACLSVIVHAIRLNILEFSNHLGVEWSGLAYRPFGRKQV